MSILMKSSTKPEESRNPSSASSSINVTGSLRNHIITRSDHCPTTFVQADTSSFKHVVQMLTGSSSPRSPDSPSPLASSGKGNFAIPPIKTAPPKKQTGFKLYERRHNLKNSPMINTLMIGSRATGFHCNPIFSPRNREILSPSCLDFPKLGLNSPVTPLKNNEGDPFDKVSPLSEEEKAIAKKGFYLHPSPISTPRDSEPQLLPLFPVSSPRVSPEESH